jgi:diacylglycerol O-acyltransferase
MRTTAARRSYPWSRPGRGGDLPPCPRCCRRALRNNLRSPLRIAETRHARGAGPVQAAQDRRRRREEPKHPVPPTRFNVDLSPHKMFDARSCPSRPEGDPHAAGPGVTINDVVLASAPAACAATSSTTMSCPRSPLIAWVPINARPRAATAGICRATTSPR